MERLGNGEENEKKNVIFKRRIGMKLKRRDVEKREEEKRNRDKSN